MKNFVLIILIWAGSINLLSGQEVSSLSTPTDNSSEKSGKYLIGFNLVLPTGIQPSTALTDASFGEPLGTSYGFGILIQRKMTRNFNLFFDINMYNYNMFLASQGSDVQSSWTLAEGATHWDEPGAPQILYVHNLPTDVHFDMQTTGFRLGGKYIFGEKKIQPWVGAAYGLYKWQVNYFNENKEQTYGTDSGFVTGLTALLGVDYYLTDIAVITAFVDVLSPIANYSIEGLFYDQWNITNWDSPIFGQYRFGITISIAN